MRVEGHLWHVAHRGAVIKWARHGELEGSSSVAPLNFEFSSHLDRRELLHVPTDS